jgi:hypothetical protein
MGSGTQSGEVRIAEAKTERRDNVTVIGIWSCEESPKSKEKWSFSDGHFQPTHLINLRNNIIIPNRSSQFLSQRQITYFNN